LAEPEKIGVIIDRHWGGLVCGNCGHSFRDHTLESMARSGKWDLYTCSNGCRCAVFWTSEDAEDYKLTGRQLLLEEVAHGRR
jgi:hypothetical protein